MYELAKAILIDLCALLLQGFILKHLWNWFVVKTLNLPYLSILEAIGLTLIMALLTSQYVPIRGEEERSKQILYQFILPLILFVFGWGFHFLI